MERNEVKKKSWDQTMKEYRKERRAVPENAEKHRERNRELYYKKNKQKRIDALKKKADVLWYKLVEKTRED